MGADLLRRGQRGNRTKLVDKDLAGDTAKDATTEYGYGKADGSRPGTLTKVTKKYVTASGDAVTAEAQRLYELTGETKSVTSTQTGDKQNLSWTYDGQIERITGQGDKGKTAYLGLGDKCLDLTTGVPLAGQPLELYPCNGTPAQQWTFTPVPGQGDANLGTLSAYDDWCVQPATNTAGAAVQMRRCDGSAYQRLARTSVGQLRHTASNLCLAVKDAATANGTPIVLAACDGATAAQQWEAQNDTRHIYGPGGSRLLTIQNRQATLHLGEAELTVGKGGTLVSAHRAYAAPGGTVLRYTTPTVASSLVALVGDHQGSPYAEVVLNGAMASRIRKQDPFGNQRGISTAGVNLQNHKGFLGATRDDASGYTPLGARLYDPVVGRFLSADPVLDLADPLQSNGYTYAHNNPVTLSDPSGLPVSLTPSETAAALAGAGLSAAQVADAQAASNRSLASVILSVAWEVLKDFIGINDALACFGGDMWSCGSLILDAIPWTKSFKVTGKILKAIDRTIGAIQAFQKAKKAAEAVLKAAKAAQEMALRAKKLALERAKKAAQAAKKKAADAINTTSNKALNGSKKTGNPVQKAAQSKSNPKSSSAGGSKNPGKSGGGGNSGGGDKAGGGGNAGGSSGGSSRGNSGSSGGDDRVTVYRGTDHGLENAIADETGMLMSDAARSTYAATGSLDEAVAASARAHASGVASWGSESLYAQAHGAFGTEISQIGPRSMMSFTTDLDVARRFGGTIYSAKVPRSQLISQTLPGAGEAEVLIQGIVRVARL